MIHASSTVNRKTAAVLAALFMVCTAFVVLANDSEAAASGYNDAEAFGNAVKPQEAALPESFDDVWSEAKVFSSNVTYTNKTILIESGAILKADADVTITLDNSSIYFETGTMSIQSQDHAVILVLNGDSYVNFGLIKGETGGFTIGTGDKDYLGNVLVFLPAGSMFFEVSETEVSMGMDYNVEDELKAGLVVSKPDVWMIMLGPSYLDYTYFYEDGDWKFFFPSVAGGPDADNLYSSMYIEFKKSGSNYSVKQMTGDTSLLVYMMMIAMFYTPIDNEAPDEKDCEVLDKTVTENQDYLVQNIIVKPGFDVAEGVKLSMIDSTVFFTPGEYNISNSFSFTASYSGGVNIVPTPLVFGTASLTKGTPSDMVIPPMTLSVKENGFTADLKGPMTMGEYTFNDVGSRDLAYTYTDIYNWCIEIGEMSSGAMGASAKLACTDGVLTLDSKAIITGDESIPLTEEEIADIVAQAEVDSKVTLSAVIGEKYYVEFDNNALRALTGNAATLEVKDITSDQSALNDKQKSAVGDRPVYSISFGDNTSFGAGKVTVTVPYTLKSGEKASGIHVAYVNADGITEKLPTSYNAEEGTVSFTTTHFSVFSVMYSESASSGIGGVIFFAAALAAAVVVLMVAAVLHFKKF